ncbi:unnamed protein product [Periconia digitata]|uniref:RRM domain-containing protein n=1 Tax=Periconia digitata TaxID=1303443 RepID=A0A9W4U387_9PLEO|nr:unnamed protein product [Periconia digitata]
MSLHVTPATPAGARAQSVPPKSSISPELSPTAAVFDPSKQTRALTPLITAGQTGMATNGVRAQTLKASPGSGAALFSTDDGRHPHRPPPGPPFTPVIVRSDPVLGVVGFANYWRNKHPHYYHCLFTQQGWGITDLWDRADIHLESPGFLKEVLKFITQDNEFRVHKFANKWSRDHTDKLDMIGGDMSDLFDPHDSLTFVYKIFTDGETESSPPEFLYQALYIMRTAMRRTVQEEEQHRASEAAMNGNSRRSSADQHFVDHAAYPAARTQSGGSVPFHPHGARGPPPGPPPSGYRAIVPSTNGQLRNPRNRPYRSNSGSGRSGAPFQNQNMMGNAARVPSEQRCHQPPGPPFYNDQSLHPHMQLEPGMMGNMGPMPHVNRPSPLHSPPFLPSQAMCPPMLQHGQMPLPPPPPTVPLDPNHPVPNYIDTANMDPRGAARFVDLTNNMQYTADRNTDRHGSLRGGHMMSRAPSLYNPYTEEPYKSASFTQVPSGRKGGRGSFSNPPTRGRNYSSGYRGSFSNTFDKDDVPPRTSSGHFNGDTGGFHYRSVPNPDIVNDMESGCDSYRIGPKNTTVKKLYVSNLPDGIKEQELLIQFRKQADATRVDLKKIGNFAEVTHAFVYFSSPAQARLCLPDNCTFQVRNKTLIVSVPYAFYRVQESPLSRSALPANTPKHRQFSLSSAVSGTVDGNARSKSSGHTQYSPQDARSDLNWANQQQSSQQPQNNGSPRARQQKSRVSPTKKTQPRLHGSLDENKPNAKAVTVNEMVEKPDGDAVDVDLVSEETGAAVAAGVKESRTEPDVVSEGIKKSTDDQSLQNTPPVKPDTLTASPNEMESEVQHKSGASFSDTTIVEVSLNDTGSDSSEQLVPDKNKDSENNVEVTRSESVSGDHQENTAGGTVSDDDQKNDLSFHSAQEVPDESTVALEEKSSVYRSTSSEPSDIIPLKTISASSQPESEATTTNPSMVEEPAKQSATEQTRKQGAKQTQSLYPFAKPSKTQSKKEKQAKKKDKRKERKEKTKTDKVESDEKSNDHSLVPIAENTTNAGPSEMDKLQNTIKSKTEIQNQRLSAYPVAPKPTSQVNFEQHPSMGSSVAQQDTVAEIPDLQQAFPRKESADISNVFPAPSVALSEPKEKVSPNSELPKIRSQAAKETSKRKIGHLSQIAVPKLNLSMTKAASSDSIAHPGNGPAEADSPNKLDAVISGQSEDIALLSYVRDSAASAATTPTLRAASPPPIPASTTTEFFTPMPTPTEYKVADGVSHSSDPSAVDLGKKKKKRKGKKKVNTTSDFQELHLASNKSEEDPFILQMNEIDDIKAKKNEGSALHGKGFGQEGENQGAKVCVDATTTAPGGASGNPSDHTD